ncbi:hypothetical protein FPV67DRAFT_1666238 [Lyophyllum atratum]|nr:hypothetical protein FPV67DRAFT_1666238 [Lyophyllum atratum]
MAVTAAASAELIAVSSLFSYDVYRTYFRPDAKGPEIVRVSHYFICFWAVWMGGWAAILHKAGVDLGWQRWEEVKVDNPRFPVKLSRPAKCPQSINSRVLFCSICPGHHLADTSLWVVMATIMLTLEIPKGIVEKGKEIIPIRCKPPATAANAVVDSAG